MLQIRMVVASLPKEAKSNTWVMVLEQVLGFQFSPGQLNSDNETILKQIS